MDENELPKKILWTNPGGQRGHGQLKSIWVDRVKQDARTPGRRNWQGYPVYRSLVKFA
jgi:hypothetical protein